MTSRVGAVGAIAFYLFGVQLPTARARLEARWNRSNRIRTAMAVVTMLLVGLMRLPAT